jgi:serine/threonine-protein kinase HipA
VTGQTLTVLIQRPDGGWQSVGRLSNVNEKNWFEFDPEYWERPDRPLLGQVFEEHGRFWVPKSNVALPRWFSHLLPEGILRDAVASAAGVNRNREFQLIHRLGRDDLPGAVRVVDAEVDPGTGSTPPPVEERDHDPTDPVLKFSLAGAQLKFSVLAAGRGLTVPLKGQVGDHIAKFPDARAGHDGVPQAELAGLELARRIGITTPVARLVDPGEITGLGKWAAKAVGMVLLVARFDRAAGQQRIHMEELAQIIDVPTARESAKYQYANHEQIAILFASFAGVESVAEVIDRIVLNVMIGNGDAHLKNWAVIYPDGARARISPVYDVVPTVLYIPDDYLGLNLNRSKVFSDVSPGSFRALGERSGFGAGAAEERAQDAARRVVESWPILAEHLPPDQYRALSDRLSTLGLPG